DRLTRYFPQLTPQELAEKTPAGRSRWHRVVQIAAKHLLEHGELRRVGSVWELTSKGARRVADEDLLIAPAPITTESPARTLTHKEAQAMLVEIGTLLGRYAEAEYEHYDVVWRDSRSAPRLSHVFEVQISGSVDSALTRLKHAYDTQRSQLFLVIADERDERFAGKRLSGSFHEILPIITVIGTGELQKLYAALKAEQALLEKLTKQR
ncbi:MAG TPA: hypothetical protein VFZ34_33865, partial [Blastocatellia bacterium]|nr:hypothetical protein [Blastocatellia bacterium]